MSERKIEANIPKIGGNTGDVIRNAIKNGESNASVVITPELDKKGLQNVVNQIDKTLSNKGKIEIEYDVTKLKGKNAARHAIDSFNSLINKSVGSNGTYASKLTLDINKVKDTLTETVNTFKKTGFTSGSKDVLALTELYRALGGELQELPQIQQDAYNKVKHLNNNYYDDFSELIKSINRIKKANLDGLNIEDYFSFNYSNTKSKKTISSMWEEYFFDENNISALNNSDVIKERISKIYTELNKYIAKLAKGIDLTEKQAFNGLGLIDELKQYLFNDKDELSEEFNNLENYIKKNFKSLDFKNINFDAKDKSESYYKKAWKIQNGYTQEKKQSLEKIVNIESIEISELNEEQQELEETVHIYQELLDIMQKIRDTSGGTENHLRRDAESAYNNYMSDGSDFESYDKAALLYKMYTTLQDQQHKIPGLVVDQETSEDLLSHAKELFAMIEKIGVSTTGNFKKNAEIIQQERIKLGILQEQQKVEEQTIPIVQQEEISQQQSDNLIDVSSLDVDAIFNSLLDQSNANKKEQEEETEIIEQQVQALEEKAKAKELVNQAENSETNKVLLDSISEENQELNSVENKIDEIANKAEEKIQDVNDKSINLFKEVSRIQNVLANEFGFNGNVGSFKQAIGATEFHELSSNARSGIISLQDFEDKLRELAKSKIKIESPLDTTLKQVEEETNKIVEEESKVEDISKSIEKSADKTEQSVSEEGKSGEKSSEGFKKLTKSKKDAKNANEELAESASETKEKVDKEGETAKETSVDINALKAQRKAYWQAKDVNDDSAISQVNYVGGPDNWSYIKKIGDSQYQSVFYTWDNQAQDFVKTLGNVNTFFERLENEILTIDKEINSLDMQIEKELFKNPNADVNSLMALRQQRVSRQNSLLTSLGNYSSQSEYQYNDSDFQTRRAQQLIELNDTLLAQEEKLASIRSQNDADYSTNIATKAYKSLIKQLEEYYNLLGKSQTQVPLTVGEEERFKELSTLITRATNQTDEFANSNLASYSAMRKYLDVVRQFKSSGYNSYVESVSNELQKMSDKLVEIQKLNHANSYIKTNASVLNSKIEALISTNGNNSGYINELLNPSTTDVRKNEILKDIAEIRNTWNQTFSSKKVLADINSAGLKIADLRKKVAKTMRENSSMGASLRMQFQELQRQLLSYSYGLSEAPQELILRFRELEAIMQETGQVGKNTWDKMTDALSNGSAQLLATFFSFYDIIRYLREAITVVEELDSALNELKVVSHSTNTQLEELSDSAYKIANAIGSSTTEVVESITSWRRLGETIEDSETLAYQSSALATGGFMDVDTATEALTSAMQAFGTGVEGVSDIVDQFIYLGNNYAITSEDLATSLENSSAALVAAGNSLEEAEALEIAGNTILQDADSVSNALKVVSMRLRGTTASELEDAGEDTEGLIEDASKLYETVKKLTKTVDNPNGISIINPDTKAYKSTYNILLEISKVYKDLTDAQQAALLETIAGKTRGAAVAAVLQNPQILSDAYADALTNAEGAGTEALETSLESIEKKINQLTNTWKQFITDIVDSELIKDIVDGLTKLGEVSDNLVNNKSAIIAIFEAITVATTAMGKGVFKINGQGNYSFFGNSFNYLKGAYSDNTNFINALQNSNSFSLSNEASRAESIALVASRLGTVDDRIVSIAQHSSDLDSFTNTLKSMENPTRNLTLGFQNWAKSIASTAKEMAATIAINMAFTFAVSGIIYAITKLATYQNDLKEQSKELGETLTELSSTFDDYNDKIQEQYDVLKSNTSTIDEQITARKELLSIQKELNSEYGSSINLLSAESQELNNSISASEYQKNYETQKAKYSNQIADTQAIIDEYNKNHPTVDSVNMADEITDAVSQISDGLDSAITKIENISNQVIQSQIESTQLQAETQTELVNEIGDTIANTALSVFSKTVGDPIVALNNTIAESEPNDSAIMDSIISAKDSLVENLKNPPQSYQSSGEVKNQLKDIRNSISENKDSNKTYAEYIKEDIDSAINTLTENLENPPQAYQSDGEVKNQLKEIRNYISENKDPNKTYAEYISDSIDSAIEPITESLELNAENVIEQTELQHQIASNITNNFINDLIENLKNPPPSYQTYGEPVTSIKQPELKDQIIDAVEAPIEVLKDTAVAVATPVAEIARVTNGLAENDPEVISEIDEFKNSVSDALETANGRIYENSNITQSEADAITNVLPTIDEVNSKLNDNWANNTSFTNSSEDEIVDELGLGVETYQKTIKDISTLNQEQSENVDDLQNTVEELVNPIVAQDDANQVETYQSQLNAIQAEADQQKAKASQKELETQNTLFNAVRNGISDVNDKINNELYSAYDGEIEKIDLLSSSATGAAKALQTIESKEYEDEVLAYNSEDGIGGVLTKLNLWWYNLRSGEDADNKFEKAIGEMSNFITPGLDTSKTLFTTDEINAGVSDLVSNYIKSANFSNLVYDKSINGLSISGDVETALKEAKQLYEYVDKINNSSDENLNGQLKDTEQWLTNIIADLNETKETYGDIVNSYVSNKLIAENPAIEQAYIGLANAVQLYEDALTSGDNNLAEIYANGYAEAYEAVRDALIQAGLDETDDGRLIMNFINDTFSEMQDAVDKNSAINDFGKLYACRIKDDIEKIGKDLSIDEIVTQGEAGQLTGNAAKAYEDLTAKANSYGMSVEEYLTLLREQNLITNKTISEEETLAAITKSVGSEYNSVAEEAYNNADATERSTMSTSAFRVALREWIETANGTLPTYQQMIDLADEVAEANEDAVESFVGYDALSNAAEAMDSLDDAYDEFTENGRVSVSTLAGLDESWTSLSGFTEFENIATNVKSTKAEIQQAFDDIVKEYINNNKVLEDLTEENKETYEKELTDMGVGNADEVVEGLLKYRDSEEAVAIATSAMAEKMAKGEEVTSEYLQSLDGIAGRADSAAIATDVLSAKQAYLDYGFDNATISGKGLDQALIDSCKDFIETGDASDIAILSLFDLITEMKIFSNTDLDNEGKLRSLEELAEGFGLVTGAAKVADEYINYVQAQVSGEWISEEQADNLIARKTKEEAEKYKNMMGSQFSDLHTTASTEFSGIADDASDSADDTESEFESLLDDYLSYLETKLDNCEIDLDQYLDAAMDKIQSFYDQGLISAEKYWSSIQQVYEKEKDTYDDVISAVEDLYDEKIDDINDQIDAIEEENDALQDQLDLYDDILSAVDKVFEDEINRLNDTLDEDSDTYDSRLKAYDDEIQNITNTLTELNYQVDQLNWALDDNESILSGISKYYDDVTDAINDNIGDLSTEIREALGLEDSFYDDKSISYYEDELEALEDANSAREDSINLDKALYELDRAENQKTKAVFKDGQLVYDTDNSEIQDARDELEEQEYEKEKKALEDQKELLEDKLELIEEYRDVWNDVADSYDNENNYNKMVDYLASRGGLTSLFSDTDSIQSLADELTAQENSLKKTLDDLQNEKYTLAQDEDGNWIKVYADGTISAYEQLQEDTENAKQDVEDAIQKQIDDLEEKQKAWSELTSIFEDQQNLQKATNLFGDNWQQQVLDGTLTIDTVISSLGTSISDTYTLTQASIQANEQLIEDLNDEISLYEDQKEQWSELASAYEDFQNQIILSQFFGSDYEAELFNNSDILWQTFQGNYETICSNIATASDNAARESYNSAATELGLTDQLLSAEKNTIINTYIADIRNAIGNSTESDGTLTGSIGTAKASSDSFAKQMSTDSGFEVSAIGKVTTAVTGLDSALSSAKATADALASAIESIDFGKVTSAGNSGGLGTNGSSTASGTAGAEGTDANGLSSGDMALTSEYGQAEMIVTPDGQWQLTTTPTLQSLPKGTVIYDNAQTKELLKGTSLSGKAYAKGTGEMLRLADADPRRFQMYSDISSLLVNTHNMLASMRDMITPLDSIQKSTYEAKTTSVGDSNYTFGNITVNCPGVTEAEVAKNLPSALEDAFKGLALNAYQQSMKR